MKKYLKITVTRKDGTTFENPLQLKEVHLVSIMAQENRSLHITVVETNKSDFKTIFGI